MSAQIGPAPTAKAAIMKEVQSQPQPSAPPPVMVNLARAFQALDDILILADGRGGFDDVLMDNVPGMIKQLGYLMARATLYPNYRPE